MRRLKDVPCSSPPRSFPTSPALLIGPKKSPTQSTRLNGPCFLLMDNILSNNALIQPIAEPKTSLMPIINRSKGRTVKSYNLRAGVVDAISVGWRCDRTARRDTGTAPACGVYKYCVNRIWSIHDRTVHLGTVECKSEPHHTEPMYWIPNFIYSKRKNSIRFQKKSSVKHVTSRDVTLPDLVWRSGANALAIGDTIPPVLSIYPSSTEDTHLSPFVDPQDPRNTIPHRHQHLHCATRPSALATGRLQYVQPAPHLTRMN